MATLQESFDTIVKHARGMTERSIVPETDNGYEGCAYRDGNGGMCFFGALMPDDHPMIARHRRAASNIIHDSKGMLQDIASDFKDYGLTAKGAGEFFDGLQRAHDCEGHWDERGLNSDGWQYLASAADEVGLDISSLEDMLE